MPIIWSMVAAAENDALLVVDKQNSSLKRVNLLNGIVDVLYRSSDSNSLLGAAFVADSQNRMPILLLAEMQSNAAEKTMTYSLAVAEQRGATWTSTQRFPHDSAPSDLRDGSFASICAMRTNKVLCGVNRSASIDVISVNSAGEARKECFAHQCFTCGVCDGTEMLFVSEHYSAKVHILEVCDGAPLALQLLRCISSLGERLLWRDNGLLFSGEYNSNANSVRVWRVSRCGRAELLEDSPITCADNVQINCWCSIGDKIAIWDWNSKQLNIYTTDMHK